MASAKLLQHAAMIGLGVGFGVWVIHQMRPEVMVKPESKFDANGEFIAISDVTRDMPLQSVHRVSELEWLAIFKNGQCCRASGPTNPFQWLEERPY